MERKIVDEQILEKARLRAGPGLSQENTNYFQAFALLYFSVLNILSNYDYEDTYISF